MTPRARHLEAVAMLVLATACWSLSFPVMKTMMQAQQDLLPGVSTWFLSALCVLYRFALAAAGMAVLAAPGLRGLTRSEVAQGVGLGLFGSGGWAALSTGRAGLHQRLDLGVSDPVLLPADPAVAGSAPPAVAGVAGLVVLRRGAGRRGGVGGL